MFNLIDTRGFEFLQRVRGVQRIATGLLLEMDFEQLRVDVLRPDVLRLKISAGGRFDERPTHAACFSPGPAPTFDVVETVATITLRTDACELRIVREPFSIEGLGADGACFLRNARYGALNDRFVVVRACAPEDAILGLGEKTGPFDRADPGSVHMGHGADGGASAVEPGLPPMPLAQLHAGLLSRDGPDLSGQADPLRCRLARHRLHKRVPRVHVGYHQVSRCERDARPVARDGPARDHDHRSRCES